MKNWSDLTFLQKTIIILVIFGLMLFFIAPYRILDSIYVLALRFTNWLWAPATFTLSHLGWILLFVFLVFFASRFSYWILPRLIIPDIGLNIPIIRRRMDESGYYLTVYMFPWHFETFFVPYGYANQMGRSMIVYAHDKRIIIKEDGSVDTEDLEWSRENLTLKMENKVLRNQIGLLLKRLREFGFISAQEALELLKRGEGREE